MSFRSPAHREAPPELEPLIRLARGALGRMTPEQSLSGEVTIAQRVERSAGRARARKARTVALSLCAMFSVLGLTASIVHKNTEKTAVGLLSYVVENGLVSADGSIDVDEGPARIARFSDGTEVRIEKGTEARVRFVTARGAALTMSRGTLHAAVVHSSTSEWRFDAGPFVVHVTGTEFGLSWDPAQDRFDLRMEHGSVTVTSPVANEPIPVRAGQWLTIRARSNEVFIRDLTGQEQTEQPAPEISANEPSEAPSGDVGLPAEPQVAPRNAHDWAADLAHGRVEQIVDDALRRGLDGCLTEASSSELAALADAARYTRHDAIAQKTLLTERHRFPGSRSALTAALLLGRLSEAEHDDGHALSWFNTYLTEAPAGPYASEVLGRKMALVRRSSGAAAARAVAQEYLAKYADGTYSSAARAILKTP
jgi:hypothetical protein